MWRFVVGDYPIFEFFQMKRFPLFPLLLIPCALAGCPAGWFDTENEDLGCLLFGNAITSDPLLSELSWVKAHDYCEGHRGHMAEALTKAQVILIIMFSHIIM